MNDFQPMPKPGSNFNSPFYTMNANFLDVFFSSGLRLRYKDYVVETILTLKLMAIYNDAKSLDIIFLI